MSIINYNPNSNDKIVSFLGDTNQEQLVPISALGINQNIIYDNVTLTGTSAATTTTYLNYGTNVITTASLTNYAIRLPYPPIKGKSVTIINVSDKPIVVYPSINGGSINNVVNGAGIVPADGKSYTFTCWENPLPGAWSWMPPAINQYDSGEIAVITPGSSQVITAVNASFYNTSTGLNSSGGGALDPFFMKDVPMSGASGLGSLAKPSTVWNSITKVKVYTNILTLNVTSGGVGLYAGGNYTTVDNSTGIETGISSVSSTPYVSDVTASATWQTVPGTPAAGAYSANIGDAGTKYIELPCSLFSPNNTFSVNSLPTLNSKSSTFGSVFLGQEVETETGISYNKWFSQYFWLYIIPRGSAGQTLKLQFFIEYN